ncbi:MAG: RNA polymerase factor sigma-54 [Pirellulales bacterium]|nr:RNA polymerase factor sigma-54 [Pirellulales bacterium]
MRLSFGQELRLVQKQILAPRMIQSMEILQLPIMALEERIDQELQENPLLELREEDPDLPDEGGDFENPDAPTTEERELVVDETKNNEADFERLLEMDREFPDHFEDRPRVSSGRMEEEGDRKHDAMANMASRPQSLQDYLCDQLAWFNLDAHTRDLAERIIYALDGNGYLHTRLEELLDPTADESEVALAQQALAVVQKLDPPGVGARDLRECLLLQVQPGMPFAEQLRTLISSHLEDLEHNRLPVIERKTGYSLDMIRRTVEQLRTLNPKPGASFESAHVPTVTPDVFIDQVEGGRYQVRLEEGNTPNLFIAPYYRQMLMSGDPEAREYIKRKINSAQWLIDSIEQRRNTLTKVAQAIVDHQTEFLNKGPEFIEPLKMQQIADKVGVHVTTVSRAVDDKWVQTPRGIFPLKRFFGGGTTSASGEEVAWDTVRLKLQEIIDHEDKQNPLSDDDLVGELAKHGLTVARRTVTKYRKAMKIPSSRQRKDWTLVNSAKKDKPAAAVAPVELDDEQDEAVADHPDVEGPIEATEAPAPLRRVFQDGDAPLPDASNGVYEGTDNAPEESATPSSLGPGEYLNGRYNHPSANPPGSTYQSH